MPFQPFNADEKLYYPSTQAPVGQGTYSTAGLTSAGDRLYAFRVGDYAYASLTPIPHVEITIYTVASTAATATVYRRAAGRRMPVRGQINVPVVGGLNVIDWEAPFGTELAYQAQQFDSEGNDLGYTAPFTVTVDVDETWVQNPFDPINGRQVTFAADAAATRPRPTDVNTVWASGSGVATSIATQRHGLTDGPISFFTRTPADSDAVSAMLGDPYTTPSSPPVLVIRTGARQQRMRLPQPLIAVVDLVETDVNGQQGGDVTLWAGTATEIQSPAPALVPALLTLGDIEANFATLGDIEASFATLGDIDKDYSIAGTAGD